jgi:superoxide dismutase
MRLLFSTIIASLVFMSAFAQAPYSLPKLDYDYNALEPHIDAMTMEIHHSRHHQAYINNLNKALVGNNAEKIALEDLLVAAERRGAAIRNNGGGHYNHSLFWSILSPDADRTPNGILAEEINKTFTSLDSLKKLVNAAASTRFGSGWAWVYVTPQKKLAVTSTSNQDNPIMDASKDGRGIPILGIDVWEHAYYLKFQNKRGDYLTSVWNVIDWDAVDERYQIALKSPLLKVIEKDAWSELKDFHMVMAQTFHPMEEGNFAPIKARATEMSAKAKVLAAGKIPSSFDNTEIKKAIADLVVGSEKLEKLVKKGKEPKIKESLTKLHDVFHKIQELCAH